jgi:Protein of unknown function (DUF2971)
MKTIPRLSSIQPPQILEIAIQDYQAWTDRQMESVQKKTAVSKPLYHYTDAAGLKGIIANQVFWLTDFRHLNDPTEMHHGMSLARPLINAGAIKRDRAGLLYSMLEDLFTFRNFSTVFSFFVACFTRKRDDLGQWRLYADDGRGFAIGLSPRLFAVKTRLGKVPTENVFVSPVFYDNAKTIRRHREPIEQAVAIFLLACNYAHRHLKHSETGVPFLRELALQVIASPLIWNCLTCKHSGYRAEDEVRLIVLGQRLKFKKYRRTRQRNGKAVPYIESHMPLHDKNSIYEIIIGPAAPANAETYVKKVLKDAGIKFPIPIRRSKLPYRSFK